MIRPVRVVILEHEPFVGATAVAATLADLHVPEFECPQRVSGLDVLADQDDLDQAICG